MDVNFILTMNPQQLSQFLLSKDISQQGRRSIEESQVDGYVFMQLQEEDIKDLFSIFLDRFKIRKIKAEILGKQKTSNTMSLMHHQSAGRVVKPQAPAFAKPAAFASCMRSLPQSGVATTQAIAWSKNVVGVPPKTVTSLPAGSPVVGSRVLSPRVQSPPELTFSEGSNASQSAVSQMEPDDQAGVQVKSEECVTIDDDDAVIILPPEPPTPQVVLYQPNASPRQQVALSSPPLAIPDLRVTSVYSQAIATLPSTGTAEWRVTAAAAAAPSAARGDEAREKFLAMYRSCPYTAHDMLQKKQIRGCSTLAQRYFYNAMRDAAHAVDMWERPSLVCDISPQTRERFFDILFFGCPKLHGAQSIIWHRLSDALHNRRKYLRDKESGKRILKGTRNNSRVLHSSTYASQ